jgi:hypothetical protein
MAFSDFKSIFDVESMYQTVLKKKNLFAFIDSMPLPELFMQDLQYSLNIKKPNPSEIAISENLISPIIRYVARKHQHINFWSREYDLRYDDKLCGIPDYLFSYTEDQNTVSKTMP